MQVRPLLILLALALAAMPACVVPVAPNFQDPPPRVDAPPYVPSASPKIGDTVAIAPGGSQLFSVQLTDATVGATIYYRWAFDFPEFDPVTTRSGGPPQAILPRVDGQPSFATVQFTLDCTILPAPSSGPVHFFTLIVTDRPFSSAPGQLDQIDDKTGHTPAFSIWSVSMSCPIDGTSATVGP